jgi:DNA-binding IclR family transcriptional regulator
MSQHWGNTMQRVQAVERSVMLLRYVSSAGGPVGIRECSRTLGVPRSALHRIAHTLAVTGMLQTDADGRYRLGPLARGIAGGFAEDHQLLRAALREMETELKDVTSHVGRVDGGRVLVLAAREGQGPVKVSVHAGDRFYVHCTAIGKALLASLDDTEVADIVRAHGLPPRTPHTITTPAAFRRELVQVQRRGFSVTMEESTLGVASVGVPIRAGGAVPKMALSVSVAVQDVRTREALNRLAQRVLLSAERIAAAAPDRSPDDGRQGPAPAGLAAR